MTDGRQYADELAEHRARRQRIAEAISSTDKSYGQIAREEGVSRQRIHQIAREFGVARKKSTTAQEGI